MHIGKVFEVIGCPDSQSATKRNRYVVALVLVYYILRRRLATPPGSGDLEGLFIKKPSQFSEIFWEGWNAY